MYFRCDEEIHNKTVYLEVTYIDSGYFNFGVQYNSTSQNYHQASTGFENFVLSSKRIRTAVFELKNADFRNAQNLESDLRLFTEDINRMFILLATIYLEPTMLFRQFDEDWISPYAGQVYEGENTVSANTLTGKTICGYQGWFRAAGDATGQGWVHYADGSFDNRITVDLWPDMTEYSDSEKYPVPGWTYEDGSRVYLFSSANKKTVIRHFKWMEAYGIDGVAVQRFVSDHTSEPVKETFRIPGYAREAANRTGRIFYIMYDLSGCDTNKITDILQNDWQFFVDSMKITEDPRYLHHNGKPVVGIFGFFADRFSSLTGNKILDLFQHENKYGAFIAGFGQWPWRNESSYGWLDVYKRMDAYIPWNIGNYIGDYANTNEWAADKTVMDNAGCLYMPLVYPGFSWDNMHEYTPGTSLKPRLEGDFLWQQFLDAKALNAQAIYVAMFDEIDEGTAIFKISNDLPVNHYFVDLEGLPSDFYLLLTGHATKMLRDEIAFSAIMPDFSDLSQPSIPFITFPAFGDTVVSPVPVSWTPAVHATGTDSYELVTDEEISKVTGTDTLIFLEEGIHALQVRAKNNMGNKGGYSEIVRFLVSIERPGQPELICPDMNETQLPVSLTFTWRNLANTDSFHIQISVDEGFSDIFYSSTGIQDSFIFVTGFDMGATYYWRLRGINRGGKGTWSEIRSFSTETGVGLEEDYRVQRYSLNMQQNIPNPFNATTSISINVTEGQLVVLEIINAMGEKIEEVCNKWLQPGAYEFVFNGSALPSGIYYCRLKGRYTILAGKMLLIK